MSTTGIVGLQGEIFKIDPRLVGCIYGVFIYKVKGTELIKLIEDLLNDECGDWDSEDEENINIVIDDKLIIDDGIVSDLMSLYAHGARSLEHMAFLTGLDGSPLFRILFNILSDNGMCLDDSVRASIRSNDKETFDVVFEHKDYKFQRCHIAQSICYCNRYAYNKIALSNDKLIDEFECKCELIGNLILNEWTAETKYVVGRLRRSLVKISEHFNGFPVHEVKDPHMIRFLMERKLRGPWLRDAFLITAVDTKNDKLISFILNTRTEVRPKVLAMCILVGIERSRRYTVKFLISHNLKNVDLAGYEVMLLEKALKCGGRHLMGSIVHCVTKGKSNFINTTKESRIEIVNILIEKYKKTEQFTISLDDIPSMFYHE